MTASSGNDTKLFFNEIQARMRSRQPPFKSRSRSPIETILSSGFYNIYYEAWKEYFGENILVVDGSKINSQPGIQLIRIQKYLKIEPEITEDSFVYNSERKFYCLKSSNRNCLGSGKGRSERSGLNFEFYLHRRLQNTFRPFDDDLAGLTDLKFNWNY